MKKEIGFVFLFILLVEVGFILSQDYYDDYGDVILVCNNASSVSLEICDYFVEKRISLGFNESCRVNLVDVSTSETINDAEYYKIKAQVNATLQNCSEVNYIVTTKGVPLRTSNRAVDSKLMYDLGATNNYYNVGGVFSREDYGGVLITRLTGVSVQDVKNLIDNSLLANLEGYFLLNNKRASQYLVWDYAFPSFAHSVLIEQGYSAELNDTLFVKNRDNLIGYFSWGSNSGVSGSANSSNWNLSFNPGAIGETAVSTSARTFNQYPWNSGQSLISDLIRMNITGVKGYVYEPYTDALANTRILFDMYTTGYNLADSYYMASLKRNWMDVVVGDPKTAIVKDNTAPAISLNDLINGERIKNGTLINLSIIGTQFFEIQNVWYNYNGSNINLESPYNVNTSNWSEGTHYFLVYANDSNNNMGHKNYTLIIDNNVRGVTPNYNNFNGNTTNFKNLTDKEGVDGAVLEIEGLAKIEFLEDGLNFSELDLDSNIDIGYNSIRFNSNLLSPINVSSRITLYSDPSENYPREDYLAILRDGVECNSTTLPSCNNLTLLNSSTVIFNVSAFSNYSLGYSDKVGISNCEELQNIREDVSKDYILLNDVDCSATRYWNYNGSDYLGFSPIGNWSSLFTGTLDGNGYIISELYIYMPNSDYVGLFGVVSSGNFYKVGLEEVNVSGKDYTGGLMGGTWGVSYINESYITGVITGNSQVGGLMGFNEDSILSSVYFNGNVSAISYAGGLTGNIDFSPEIYNSYSVGFIIISGNYAGGLLGSSSSSTLINNSYSTCLVSANNYLGGISSQSSSTVLYNSYWYNSSNNPSNCYNGGNTGCTAIQESSNGERYFFNVSNGPMDSWDFENVWDSTNDLFNYPVLKWQNVSEVQVGFSSKLNKVTNYTLNRDVLSNGTAFEIGVNGVVFNFSNYNVTGNGSGYGIYVNAKNNSILYLGNIFSYLREIYISQAFNTILYSKSNSLNVTVNGTGVINFTTVMPGSSKSYYVLYDGVNCNENDNCSLEFLSGGKLNLSVDL